MSYLTHDFPHTRNQDSDLSEIIRLFKVFSSKVENLDSLITARINEMILDGELSEILTSTSKNIYIGDSWCEAADGWWLRLNSTIKPTIYSKYGLGGLGWSALSTSGKSLSDLINDIITAETNSAIVKNIVVVLGINDYSYTDTIYNNALTALNNLRNAFPNATIYVAYNNSFKAISTAVMNNVEQVKKACLDTGASFISVSWTALYGLHFVFQADEIHPTEYGYTLFANYLSAWILHGNNFDFETLGNGSYSLHCMRANGVVSIHGTLDVGADGAVTPFPLAYTKFLSPKPIITSPAFHEELQLYIDNNSTIQTSGAFTEGQYIFDFTFRQDTGGN